MTLRPLSIALCLLLSVSACSTMQTSPDARPEPPKLQALLEPETVKGTPWASVEDLKADPESTPTDLWDQLHATEAALRKANRDQLDASAMLEAEQDPAQKCGFFRRLSGKCFRADAPIRAPP